MFKVCFSFFVVSEKGVGNGGFMKFSVLILGLLVAAKSYAVNDPKNFALACEDSSSRFSLMADGDKMRLIYDNAEGFNGFPIYNGVVSQSFLASVNRGAKDLKPFGDGLNLTWDLSGCKTVPDKPYLLECRGLAGIDLPKDDSFLVTSLTTSTETVTRSDIGESNSVTANFTIVKKDGAATRTYFIRLGFQTGQCSVKKAGVAI
jgi:hypothetical protein